LAGSERKSRNSVYENYDLPEQSRQASLMRHLPIGLGGAMLVAALLFSGNLIGRNASASNAPESLADIAMLAPTTDLEGKGSLIEPTFDPTAVNMSALRRQTVISEGKGDSLAAAPNVVHIAPPPVPKAKPANMANIVATQKSVKIIPASYSSDDEEDAPAPAVKRMLASPAVPSGPVVLVPPAKRPVNLPAQQEAVAPVPQPLARQASAVDQAPVAAPSPIKAIALQRIRTAELTCLARAVYFESRSESELGQLAVAKVILNRVKHPDFPKTICGVVYQGSEKRNACQFSFACDGLPDVVRSPEAWARAKRISERALADDPSIRMLQAVNYHADYVTPRWSRTMKRIIRIGHHIFYSRREQG
jgi:spore germination cell wall hydrolase CwlJ-like protein